MKYVNISKNFYPIIIQYENKTKGYEINPNDKLP